MSLNFNTDYCSRGIKRERHKILLRTRFTEGGREEGLGVPYPKGGRPGTSNIGYVDLKKEPDRISEIHEIRDWPEAVKFLKEVNRPQSLFHTLRCDVWIEPVEAQRMRSCAISYFTVAFEIFDWNGPKGPYQDLYERFRKFAALNHTPGAMMVEFHLIPTSYNYPTGGQGWSVDIMMFGFGETGVEAKATWRAGLKLVQDYLVRESDLYGHELRKGRKTLGSISE